MTHYPCLSRGFRKYRSAQKKSALWAALARLLGFSRRAKAIVQASTLKRANQKSDDDVLSSAKSAGLRTLRASRLKTAANELMTLPATVQQFSLHHSQSLQPDKLPMLPGRQRVQFRPQLVCCRRNRRA